MIRSFSDRDTEKIFRREFSRRLNGISTTAKRRLDQLHAAYRILDLATLPGNRLEALKGDRAGQHSIRVNAQWRVCFIWIEPDAFDVTIVDYHA